MTMLRPDDEGLVYVGCLTCGFVTTFPLERLRAEGAPSCVHNHHAIAFGPQQRHPKWTEMVRVSVTTTCCDAHDQLQS